MRIEIAQRVLSGFGAIGGSAEFDGVQVRGTELTVAESDGDMAEG